MLAQLYDHGLGRQTARRRIRRGAWREPLPGVVCRTSGPLSPRQWLVLAGAYGGAGSAVSHGSAGAFWGLLPHPPAAVHVTVPHGRHRRSDRLVVVHQSRRPFRPALVEDLLVTPPARTAVDMGLELTSYDSVTALLGRALQRGRVSLETLAEELDAAPRRAVARCGRAGRWPTWPPAPARPRSRACCS